MNENMTPVPVVVVECADGPLLVRGEIEILSADGIRRPQNRKTIALCRCGASSIKPFCDGTHKLVGFKTAAPEDLPQPDR
ncbi:CDGSH iron-sulfur domain-containing protein [Glaciibacter sp. 2TAF33]|uniref:CDGSH iron-sulfur domain-containing protein n=1 Tax=Glaciibacter sp. 2TAF33 TaxID=3233015 RepID=UPI003F90AF12